MKIIYMLLAAIIFVSCSTFKLSVSDELKSNHDEYEVKGRQVVFTKENLSFGEYATTKVKRSWTKGSSSRTGIGYGGSAQQEWVNLISTEYIRKKQTVNFSLTDSKLSSQSFCVSRFNARDLNVGNDENSIFNIALDITGAGYRSSSLYYIQVFVNNEETPWQLVLDNQASQAQPKKYTGVFAKSKSEYYTLVPITKLEKKDGKTGSILGGSVGFEIKNNMGVSVAAVSQLDKGMVYLAKTNEEERFLLANLCAALLLQQHIED